MAEAFTSYISTNAYTYRHSSIQLSSAQGCAKGEETVGGQDAEENRHRFSQTDRSRES